MSGGTAGSSGKSRTRSTKAPSKTAGSRDFARRARAARERATRRQTVRARGRRSVSAQSTVALLRESLRRIPRAAFICALLAIVNAACWSLITPPFQSTDEPDHFAYVQLLAETGELPSSGTEGYSQEQSNVMRDLRQANVRFRPEGHTISSHAQYAKLQHDLAAPLSGRGSGGTGLADSEPPLYYALETIPYWLASSGSLLDQLELMRLLSALMGGITALFAFLFLREALPGVRWAWTVGGLGVALSPLLGAISGAVNPDAMLFAVCAALFYCLARAFRRGLTLGSSLVLGALIALGFLTKLNFLGLAPGAILGLILLAHRQARASGSRVYSHVLVPGLLIALFPLVLYAFSSHPVSSTVSGGVSGLTGAGSSIGGELSYIWQFYLPQLPGMHSYFGDIFTTRQIWFKDLVGLYGWSDTVFPDWVYDFALIPAALIAILCLRELVGRRAALGKRLVELAIYGLMTLGVLVLIGADGYLSSSTELISYAEPRYLLPMVVLWGAILALAARGGGRRWGPAVGALIVVLVLGHDIFSQLQVVARYYG